MRKARIREAQLAQAEMAKRLALIVPSVPSGHQSVDGVAARSTWWSTPVTQRSANTIQGYRVALDQLRVDQESGGVEILKKDILYSEEECGRSLFGKVIRDRRDTLLGIKRTMSSIWRINQRMEVRELESNFFQFIFSSGEHKRKVGAGVKNVSVCKVGGETGSYIKLLASIDIKEPIPRCTFVKLDNQRIMVYIWYEKLVNLCYYCGHIGHVDRNCSMRLRDIKSKNLQEGQYGEWLKVGENIYGSKYSCKSDLAQKEREEPLPTSNNESYATTSTARHPHPTEVPNARNGGDTPLMDTPKEGSSPKTLDIVSSPGNEEGKGDSVEESEEVMEVQNTLQSQMVLFQKLL
ncbi:Unknown protein [Striga hermonthica]|uniref:CCHC-type domain-containing protein n=1 Tax=Striga hermonthica TaxID=68872 RepID=A0A9N7MNU2_STRHE|nr:Unknown protein [Striga hermonthica]